MLKPGGLKVGVGVILIVDEIGILAKFLMLFAIFVTGLAAGGSGGMGAKMLVLGMLALGTTYDAEWKRSGLSTLGEL